VFALASLVIVGVLSFAENAYGQVPAQLEWADRHPPPSSNPPALDDIPVGTGTNGTHVFSVYERALGAGYTNFQLVKYDLSGNVVAEEIWPDDADYEKFSPRAMKVIHTDSPARTDIFIAGDIFDSKTQGRRLIVMSFNENLKLRWTWLPDVPDAHTPDERAVALDANESHVAVVGRVLDTDQKYKWLTMVLNRVGIASHAMVPQLYTPEDHLGQHVPTDWPVSISLAGTEDPLPIWVGVLGERTSTGRQAIALLYEIVDDPPAPRVWHSWPAVECEPVKIKLTHREMVYIGLNEALTQISDMAPAVYMRTVVGGTTFESRLGHTNAGGAISRMNDLAVYAPPGIGGVPPFLNAMVWITGSSINNNTEDVLTIQYKERVQSGSGGTQFVRDVDWVSIWPTPGGGQAQGLIVAPRSDYGAANEPEDEHIYVFGRALDATPGATTQLLMLRFDAALPTGAMKVPQWDEQYTSNAGGHEWPVSAVERANLGGFRRMVLGKFSGKLQSALDMVTSQFEDTNP
jgi:hypothetical protein